jgi:hypothetical protein
LQRCVFGAILRFDPERCPSGLRSSLGKAV